ncbi:DMT family transporter [Porphyrobacter sp. GA68]|uniref:DMT family transporter n=1 Tax=Porphyrobacter sp. GA68 TaxID=2883480 RepID=UPI001D191F78|nr:DMT family transporter [Porphyrobacter sp. GA68]
MTGAPTAANGNNVRRDHPLVPILVTLIGVGLFSAMDAAIKAAALAVGAYSAFFIRCVIGLALIAPVWRVTGGRWPARAALRVHLIRGVVVAFMGWSFFFAVVRLPLAEAIAISFIAPLVALWLSALMLGEKVRREAVIAALLGLAGTLVIVSGRIGRERMTEDAVLGLAAIIFSALLYAFNLVLQRQQALLAKPLEIGLFQNGVVALVLLGASPWLLQWPQTQHTWLAIIGGAVLAIGALLCFSWAYRRAEAQALVPIEYSGFLWAALFGWLFFAENVTVTTATGAVLIVLGCWITARPRRPLATAV